MVLLSEHYLNKRDLGRAALASRRSCLRLAMLRIATQNGSDPLTVVNQAMASKAWFNVLLGRMALLVFVVSGW